MSGVNRKGHRLIAESIIETALQGDEGTPELRELIRLHRRQIVLTLAVRLKADNPAYFDMWKFIDSCGFDRRNKPRG